MPELPEVQHAADTLGAQIIGHTIVAVTKLDWERMVETPDAASFVALLAGRTVLAAERRAKWILLTLDAGWTLALHLRMSGFIAVAPPDAVPDRYVHLVLLIDDGRQVFFHDTRKFGRARLLDTAGRAALGAAHGHEPLADQFGVDVLAAVLRGRNRAIKPLLLDQTRIAGLGNIYVDEALWRACIHPLTPAATLDAAAIDALHAAIQGALRDGLRNGGSTLRDYRNAYGVSGENQNHFAAYGRTGEPCPRCGTPIARLVVGQRGTHVCPRCQPVQ